MTLPRTRLSTREVLAMQALRTRGNTLQEIANITNRSVMTVYLKTLTIPHPNRHNGVVIMYRKTGVARTAFRAKAVAA